jgi:hypothetical protein
MVSMADMRVGMLLKWRAPELSIICMVSDITDEYISIYDIGNKFEFVLPIEIWSAALEHNFIKIVIP